MTLFHRLNSPKVVVAITAIAYLLFIVSNLALNKGDISVFIVAGDQYTGVGEVAQGISILNNSAGYDGQFYYRLALNPFTSVRKEYGIVLDVPPYRQQRILYPLMVWSLSLGRAALVPFMLIFVNYLALCVIGWLGASYARALNRNALWGLIFALYPGFLLTLARNLAEIVAICFLLAGLLSLRLRKELLAAIMLTFAVLSKETTLFVPVGILVTSLWRLYQHRRDLHLADFYSVIPIGVWSIWQFVMLLVWEKFPFVAGSGNFSFPLTGFVRLFQSVNHLTTHFQQVILVELCFILAFTLFVFYSLYSSKALISEKLAWLIYFGLAISFSGTIWIEDWSFFRALSEFYVLGSIIFLGSQIRLAFLHASLVVTWWAGVFIERMAG